MIVSCMTNLALTAATVVTSYTIVLLVQSLLIGVGQIRFWCNTGHLFCSSRKSQLSGADQWFFTGTNALVSGVNHYRIGHANSKGLSLPCLAGSL